MSSSILTYPYKIYFLWYFLNFLKVNFFFSKEFCLCPMIISWDLYPSLTCLVYYTKCFIQGSHRPPPPHLSDLKQNRVSLSFLLFACKIFYSNRYQCHCLWKFQVIKNIFLKRNVKLPRLFYDFLPNFHSPWLFQAWNYFFIFHGFPWIKMSH